MTRGGDCHTLVSLNPANSQACRLSIGQTLDVANPKAYLPYFLFLTLRTIKVSLDFVEALGSVTPGDLDFVKTFCSASEAMECAIKWTRSYHKLTGNPGK